MDQEEFKKDLGYEAYYGEAIPRSNEEQVMIPQPGCILKQNCHLWQIWIISAKLKNENRVSPFVQVDSVDNKRSLNREFVFWRLFVSMVYRAGSNPTGTLLSACVRLSWLS